MRSPYLKGGGSQGRCPDCPGEKADRRSTPTFLMWSTSKKSQNGGRENPFPKKTRVAKRQTQDNPVELKKQKKAVVVGGG